MRSTKLWTIVALAVAVLVLAPSALAAVKLPKSFPAAGEILKPKIAVRAAPSPKAKILRVLKQFRPDFHWQVILALDARKGTDGRWWYRLSIPGRPNGQRGWVRANQVNVWPVMNRIVVHRESRKVEVWRGEKLLLSAKVAVGKPGAETPLGRNFYVQSRFVPSNSFLGTFALETSAYSRLTDWPGGGVAGIHGTNAPQLLGQAVSHGCVRVSNATADALRKLAPLGTPIDILPN